MDEDENGHFTKLVQVLMNSYSSLPDNSHKNCLLYASVFPSDRPFSTNSLVRRLSAEGYIEGTNEKSDLEVAYENLEKLIDRNIIQPIDARTNSKVKTCRTNGIMNQFMLHRSRSSGFIAYFRDKNRSNCRHLIIQNQNHRNGTIIPYSATTTSGMLGKQLRPRSLTVYESAGEADSDLTSCELLRVLDLKECADLKEKHLNNIYKLLHLKYLTLGSSVTKLSDKMEKLHCLETLDLRKTKIETLPEEVITLPHLAHLFGKIKLKKVSSRSRKNLNLQTLAGVVVDNQSGFPQLMDHMKKLTKVKIWCEITSKDWNYTLLSDAIQKFAPDGIDTPVGTRCLSLHIKHSSKDLLDAPSRKSGFLSSLKLHGRPSGFPQFVKSLTGLEELCLTSTNLKVDDLSEMSMIPRLLYLKLVQFDLEGVWINLGNFPKLERLCIVLQKPGFPTIQQGALPSPLVSLQLLCKGLEDHCNHIDVNNFVCLQEIALDSMVKNDTKQIWETKAKAHQKWPRVLFLESVGPAGKYVAVDRVSSKPSVQGMA